jgi:hypothetical protein
MRIFYNRAAIFRDALFVRLLVSQLVASARSWVVSISPGFTVAEIVEFVHEYQLQPYGQKASWLAGQGLTYHTLKRWRDAVFDGDLDRGLIPREGGGVKSSPVRRTVLASVRAAEAAQHEAEVAALQARVRQLEATNEALGKAIGLLHANSEQEPDVTPPTSDPHDS